MIKDTPYSPVYKRLAVTVIFSPAIFQFFQAASRSEADESQMFYSYAALMVLPSLISVYYFLSALNKLNQIKKTTKAK
ncbi:MAG: hypothetical protein JWM07_589 [Candidatus Saccharibacteria bacterium]|nr:hypothetical protein [Candidatus Saccharibacteria bacterium]